VSEVFCDGSVGVTLDPLWYAPDEIELVAEAKHDEQA
jgi:hypothetical protein